ncbi:MAG: hypothetical protein SGJ20_19885 [Planctomycetota bacterium]|nr:hypothetical protein [Planctomycetota bacterium]
MNARSLLIVAVLVGAGVGANHLLFGDAPAPIDLKTLQRLTANNLEEQLKLFENERARTRAILFQSLADENLEVRCAAAFLLGYYRDEDAVHSLGQHLTLEYKSDRLWKRLPRYGTYPAVEALVRIGKPSVREMLRILETSDDAHERALAARVIYYVEGDDLARLVVGFAAERQKDPAKKEKLLAAIPLVRGGEFPAGPKNAAPVEK